VLSTFQARTFEDVGVDSSKLIVTPLGVDLDMFYPRPRADDGLFRVLFVGQITQRKGISYLLEAATRAALPDAELLLVGTPVGGGRPWEEYPRVRHLPHCRRAHLPSVYASADVYVLPSLVEGFPLTALEAMASGLPVVVSENTFGSDVVTDGDDGFIVPIRDADAIADRLKFLHASPEDRKRVGLAARRRATDFSWASYGDRVAAVIDAEA
jgi:glycosyltransferase involved in cell wall biosynthesis